MTAPGQRWHRDVWAEAVWSSDLPPVLRLVALAYADHARDRDSAWLSNDRLRERTGLGRTAAAAAVRRLAKDEWLVPLDQPRRGHTAHYRLALPDSEKAVSRPSEKAVSRPTAAPEGRLATPEGRVATPEGRLAAPTSGPTSGLTTSLSAREEDRPVHTTTTTTRETTSDGDTFGARALAALGRADLSAHQLDQAHKRACDRLGLLLAADAVHAVASLQPVVRNLAAYMASLSDDDLRALAEQRQHDRERTTRRSSTRTATPSPYRCEHGHANGLRRSADGGSPCAACDGAAPVPVPAAVSA